MTAITDKANLEFRDMVSPGSATPHEPEKPGIRELFSVIDIALASLGVNGAITVKKATLPLLMADLDHAADVLAVVYNDPNDSQNGIYAKIGATGTGSWAITALALPATFSAELAEVLAQIQAVDDAVVVALDAADSSAGSAATAETYKDAAESARDVALSLLPVGAATGTQPTKAALDAAVSGLADGAWLVLEDETNEGAPALYSVDTGAIVGDPAVFKRRDSLLPKGAQDYLGADDDATDNLTPFTNFLAAYPDPAPLRMPRLIDGVYYFSGFDNTDVMDGYTLQNDPNVTIRGASGQWLQQPGLRVERPITLKVDTPDYQFVYGPAANRAPVEKERYLDHGSADWRRTTKVDATTLSAWNLAWPATLYSVSPDVSNVAYAGFNTLDAGAFYALTMPILPGEEVHAVPTNIVGTPRFGFFLLLQGGHYAAYQLPGVGQVLNWYNSIGGGNGGDTYTGYSHLSYTTQKSVLSVRLLGPRSFQLIVNGYPIKTVMDVGANILEVGFGAGFASSGSYRMTNWTKTTGKKLANLPPLRCLFLGDSKWDDAVIGHADMFFKEAMEAAGGARIVEINNIAVSGSNTAQQALALAALGGAVANYQTAHIDLSTNDTQGAIPVATTIAELTNILNTLGSAKWITVAIPSLWYDKTLTPGGALGAVTSNFDAGAEVRQAIRYLCADRKNVTVFEYDEMGPIIAEWLTGYPANQMSPMVFDNIHPDMPARRLMGYAVAKALLGLMAPEPVKNYALTSFLATWFSATLQGGTYTQAAKYEIDAGGQATLSGRIDLVGSAPAALPAANTTLATLPKILRPLRDLTVLCPCFDTAGTPVYTGAVPVTVTTAGIIKTGATLPASSRYLYIEALTWPLT